MFYSRRSAVVTQPFLMDLELDSEEGFHHEWTDAPAGLDARSHLAGAGLVKAAGSLMEPARPQTAL
jgi:hypothetical protein